MTAEPPDRLGDDVIDSYQDRVEALRAVRVPCLVVGFEPDTDTFVERAREVAAAIPDARYVEIPGAGHVLPITDPHLISTHAIQFFHETNNNE